MNETLDDNPDLLTKANVALQQQRHKQLVRKAIAEYEKAGMEPDLGMAWAPLEECDRCLDPLSCDNRSGVSGLCINCLSKQVACYAPARNAHQAKVAAKSSRTQPYYFALIFILCGLAALAAWGFAAGLNQLFYWIGWHA